jgi:hypothetical protein
MANPGRICRSIKPRNIDKTGRLAALWDTGARLTCVSTAVQKKLNLRPVRTGPGIIISFSMK